MKKTTPPVDRLNGEERLYYRDGAGDNVCRRRVGRGYVANLSNVYSSATVTGSGDYAGGLIGIAVSATNVTNSDSTGSVTAAGRAGGLIGSFGAGSFMYVGINLSYATGNVTAGADGYAGGLMGYLMYNSTHGGVSNSFATGNVASSGGYAGGLMGYAEGVRSRIATPRER